MSHQLHVGRRSAIVIAVVAGMIVLAAGAAFAASFLMTTQTVGTGATQSTGCDTNGITAGVANPMTWSIGSGPGTNFEYTLSNVNTACNGKNWKATLGSATSLVCIAQGGGTLTVAGGGTATINLSTDGCDIPGDPSGTGGTGSLSVTFYD
ncbi:MAG: hypothetical protein ACOYD0_12105 [Candidatus Nanopelagicales bacterium]